MLQQQRNTPGACCQRQQNTQKSITKHAELQAVPTVLILAEAPARLVNVFYFDYLPGPAALVTAVTVAK